MHRRKFLTLLGLTVMGGLANGCADVAPASPTAGAKRRRVVVIGAGLAGLAAARVLRQQGLEVVVVEARARIGGRIWTSARWPDAPLDLGATWIHGVEGNPLTQLADEIGADRLTTSYERAVTYATAGHVLTPAEDERLEKVRRRISNALRQAQDREPEVSVWQALEPVWRPVDAAAEERRLINFIVNSDIEQEYAGSADRLSAHWYECYLRFSEVFWPADADWLEHISAQPGEWTEWVRFKHAADLPILLGFNAAERGREIEDWPDAQIVASAMQTLPVIFGARAPDPIDYQITRWATDPYALGSYSYHPVGAPTNVRQTLASPLMDRLFFAGEATEAAYFATAHGACLSGLRAAREILAR